MSKENDYEELAKEVENLKSRLNSQRILLGILSILVVLLLFQSIIEDPRSFIFLTLIAFIIIPLALLINQLEQSGL